MAKYLGDEVEKKFQQIMVHTQAKFCHSSLGARIHLKQLSIEQTKGINYLYGEEHKEANNKHVSQIQEEKINGANAALFLGYLGNSWQVMGWHGNGHACAKNGGYGLVYWLWNPAMTAWVCRKNFL